MKAVVAAFNQEKALVGALSLIVQLSPGGWRRPGPVAGEVRAKARKYPVTTRTYTDSEGQKSHNLPTLSIRTWSMRQ